MRPIHFLLALLALGAFALLVLSPVQHDYVYYLEHWQLVLSAQDPWSTNNAYGPLHNIFAWLALIHPLAPRILTGSLFLIACAALVGALDAQRPAGEWIAIFLSAIGLNALVIVSVFAYGLNDGLVAALVIAAVFARLRGRMVLAGVLLGLATLDKYYPALLIPFFAIDARKIEARLILSSLVTIAIGLAAATAIWGTLWLEAITYGVSRDASLLSILRTVTALGRSAGLDELVNLLVRINGPVVILVWLGSIALAWSRRDNWLVAATWGFFAVLLAYKAGHPQFRVTWLALVACLPLLRLPEADRLARLSLPYTWFLTIFELGYALLEPHYYQGPLLWIVQWVGVPSFLLSIALLVLWFRPASRPRT
ncbi:MAG TPA: glycosyltransferase family 87 protein [Devosia sp.]|nr:glycosyltransferase family 87 protein [Devosia sp.]